ncbi:hypothetical protein SAMN05920897_11555 [Alkalispirochaeta americana]|uniref:MORN repeat variant n=1 Tax=Alkalispirochaeta americana TaxID=159291 RepID=A0A1N6VR20_9SPIO|nr:hypothetical protein [Alkalispirochaeta americana]SIQ80265.1 hypothetical protein SAMN05920897_11555 [Alkalispirochaeta americana]
MWTTFWRPEPCRSGAGPSCGVVLGMVVFLGIFGLGYPASTGAGEPRWFYSNSDGEQLRPLDTEDFDVLPPGEGWSLKVSLPEATSGGLERRLVYYQGEMVREELLRYRPGGTLREVRRCDNAGACVSIRFAAPDAPGFESIRGALGVREIAYDGHGLPLHMRREVPGELREDTWYTYEEGRLVASRQVRGDQEILRRYQDGHLVREETRSEGRRVRLVQIELNHLGSVAQRITETRREVEREQFYPLRPGEVVRELWRGDDLVEQEELMGEGERRITRFRQGEKLFRSWFSNDTLIKREIFLDGSVVRTERPSVEDAGEE